MLVVDTDNLRSDPLAHGHMHHIALQAPHIEGNKYPDLEEVASVGSTVEDTHQIVEGSHQQLVEVLDGLDKNLWAHSCSSREAFPLSWNQLRLSCAAPSISSIQSVKIKIKSSSKLKPEIHSSLQLPPQRSGRRCRRQNLEIDSRSRVREKME